MDNMFFILLIFVLTGLVHFLIIRLVFKLNRAFPKELATNELSSPPKVTVLICAKNEATNLEKNIPIICNQDYANFQVLVVNHFSNDQTPDVLEKLSTEYTCLDVVSCTEDRLSLPGKRSALAAGLEQVKGEFVLLTDADCRPVHKAWVRNMLAAALTSDADVVLGIGRYEKESGILNKFIQFETFHTALLYISLALQALPYMGVGRNILIKNEVLRSRLAQSTIPGVLSGDDDLLVANLSFTHRIVTQISSESHTLSSPSLDWLTYFKQKRRHISTADYYRGTHRWILQLYHGCLAAFLLTGLILLFGQYLKTVLIVFLMRAIGLGWKFRRDQRMLGVKFETWLFPVFEFMLVSVPIMSWILNKLRPVKKW